VSKKGPNDPLKMEVVEELGLLEKVRRLGWGGLSARESGKVGGVMTRRLKEAGEAGPEGDSLLKP